MSETVVDLGFPIAGTTIPVDHGYPLYGALARRFPAIHGAGWIGVHPLRGKPVAEKRLDVSRSELRLRVPATKISDLLGLVGASLDVMGASLRVGAPRVWPLAPAATLDARLVFVKLTRIAPPHTRAMLEERYQAELLRQMADLEVEGAVTLCGRRTLTVRDKRLIGYSVRVSSLSAADSLALQEHGLGGKRAMGCGLFRPTRG